MENIVRNVRDIDTADRHALEHVIGQRLRENQRVIINIVSVDLTPPPAKQPHGDAPAALPEWCNVYEGMSDEEIGEVEKSIVRSPSSRSFE